VRVDTFKKLSWLTLVVTLLVIVWGAFVRASGSGAGCGSHWPTCNGEILPRPKSVATVIELTHRVTSGLSLLLTVVQLVGAFRAFPARHPARRAASASMFFMVTEALVGAGLVLFEMVATNKSAARALWMSAHLTNTFLLLASMALTLYFAYGRPAPRLSGQGARGVLVAGSALGLLAVGVAGAVVALGDTLFPARSLVEGMVADVTPGAHFLVRLRVLHPVLAVGLGGAVSLFARRVAEQDDDGSVRALAAAVNVAFLVQLGIGALNLGLLAPIPLQLVHLVVADVYWILAVLFFAATLRPRVAQAR
jgi:heme A synthase